VRTSDQRAELIHSRHMAALNRAANVEEMRAIAQSHERALAATGDQQRAQHAAELQQLQERHAAELQQASQARARAGQAAQLEDDESPSSMDHALDVARSYSNR
jgi:hypothetical protein